MIGAIIGDIVGSRFEFHNYRSKDFELFTDKNFFTDDTVMTCAVADCLINGKDAAKTLQHFGRVFPGRGYGGHFHYWIYTFYPEPYYSFGNGAAMRISPVGWYAESEEEVKTLSKKVTEITHNHPEGLKGAEVTAMCIYYLRKGYTKEEIRKYAVQNYPEIAEMDYHELVKNYRFNETCQNTVPQAIYCFLISNSFEDCLRTSISIGGDSDTLCAISCALAEAHYGIPTRYLKSIRKYFSKQDWNKLISPIVEIYKKSGNKLNIYL